MFCAIPTAMENWSRTRRDLAGQRFSHLTVIDRAPSRNKRTFWRCRCDCGRERVCMTQGLTLGHTKCCGCGVSGRKKYHSRHASTHRLYSVWTGMRGRCENPAATGFERYGGRGITVCEEWQSYDAFYGWSIANGYRPDLTLDRMGNNGPYTPQNCKWATPEEQASNKSTNVRVSVDGVPMTLTQACRKYGLQTETVRQRIERDWPDQDLFNPTEQIVILH